jgi:DNA polymerase III delta subunit
MALGLYRGLILQRTNEIYILTMIEWQLRNLLLAKASGDLPPSELTRQAGLSPYVATKAVAKRADFSLETLKTAFLEAVDCEYRVKSGRVPAEAAVEQLIYQVAAQAR